MPLPAVSVLVTTFRHAPYVEESLDSLAAQTCRDFEAIITDDASDDGTADRIERWLALTGFSARFIRNPVNRGICANRNSALALARGRFVCSLSGDDAYQPERIERQLAAFLREPEETACVYSDAILVDARGVPFGETFLEHKLGPQSPPEGDLFANLLLRDNFLPAPGVMVRRAALDEVGHYDESLYFEDLYMWLKLSRRFRFRVVPGLLVRYRMLENSMSHSRVTWPAMEDCTFRVLGQWLGRCGDLEDALVERLWFLAMRQLSAGEDATARRMLAVLTQSGKWRRRAAARLSAIPGGCQALRVLAGAYAGATWHRTSSVSAV